MSGDRYKILDQNGVYFLTLTIIDWVDVFTRYDYSLIVVDSLNYCIKNKNMIVYSWVIMPSHVHLVCQVLEPYEMAGVLRDFKKHTSREIIKAITSLNESRREWLLNKFSYAAKRTGRAEKYKVWKDDNHAVEIEGYINIEEKVEYIHQNPVKSLAVVGAENYYFSSAIDYSDGKGLVAINKY